MLHFVELHAKSESANLDFLRSAAVLSVYGSHLALTLGAHPPDAIGTFGVLIFFFHTSLVLMMSLERTEQTSRPLIRTFYIRRAFRIYPLSVACVAVIAACHLPRGPMWPWSPPGIAAILGNLLLCMNLFLQDPVTLVLWSLPYEVQMYAALPFCYLAGKRFGWRGVFGLWCLAAVVGILPHMPGRFDIVKYAPCFMAGVFGYFFAKGRAARLAWLWWPLGIGACGALFAGLASLGSATAGSWAMCLGLGFLFALVREIPFRWIATPCKVIARYSYGIYLTHLYAQWAGLVVLKHAPAVYRWGTLAALSFGLPVVAYHLLEDPMIRLGGRVAKALRAGSGGGIGARLVSANRTE